MAYPLIVTPEAEQEMANAYLWYEQQRAGLGDEYLACVDDAFGFIQNTPLAFAESYRSIRQTLVNRFPFVVCYTFDGQCIHVLAVFHGHRDPDDWKRRTE
jgi:plasmid stabilization system protein ParE